MSNPTISNNGSKIWYNEDAKLHRVDGPAVEYKDGTKAWWINGTRIYTLCPKGTTYNGDMNDIPLAIKQSIISETLKLQQ
jgi:hypothetical protein